MCMYIIISLCRIFTFAVIESSLCGSRFNFSPTFFTIVIVLFPDRATVLHSELPQPVTNEPVNQQSTSVYVYVHNHILMSNIHICSDRKFSLWLSFQFLSHFIVIVLFLTEQHCYTVSCHNQ